MEQSGGRSSDTRAPTRALLQSQLQLGHEGCRHVDAMHSTMLLFRFATDHRLTLTADEGGQRADDRRRAGGG